MGTFREQSGNNRGTFREHPGDIRADDHSLHRNIQGTIKGKFKGTFGHIQETSREYPRR
jgi:hypothetical protein